MLKTEHDFFERVGATLLFIVLINYSDCSSNFEELKTQIAPPKMKN